MVDEYMERTRTFIEYSKWTPKTSIHTTDNDAIICAIIGMASETDEYLEKMDELFSYSTDSVVDSRNRDSLKKELGDILYYIGLFVEKAGIADYIYIRDPDTSTTAFLTTSLPLRIQEHYKKVIRDEEWNLAAYEKFEEIVDLVNDLLTVLYTECEDMGFPFVEVLNENKNKLLSRLERGQIKGNGDER